MLERREESEPPVPRICDVISHHQLFWFLHLNSCAPIKLNSPAHYSALFPCCCWLSFSCASIIAVHTFLRLNLVLPQKWSFNALDLHICGLFDIPNFRYYMYILFTEVLYIITVIQGTVIVLDINRHKWRIFTDQVSNLSLKANTLQNYFELIEDIHIF